MDLHCYSSLYIYIYISHDDDDDEIYFTIYIYISHDDDDDDEIYLLELGFYQVAVVGRLVQK